MTILDSYNRHVILCDGATLPAELVGKVPDNHVWPLVQRKGKGEINLLVQIQDFITPLLAYIPDRAKDLLEIAAFIYGADRLISRGETSQVEYLKWARDFVFCIPIRELAFWQQPRIHKALVEILVFISGDKNYQFYFEQRTGADAPTSLFDIPQSSQNSLPASECKIASFSGGLDSLSGVIELLEQTSGKVVVTSHRSGPSTPVQKRVFAALQHAYPNRLIYHPLKCNLSKKRPPEETQRTRFFLYTTVGYVLAQAYGQDSLNIYENGVTSINLRRRQDLINARASRTTHPKTISLLNTFFSEVRGDTFTVQHPFLLLTKTDVVKKIHGYGRSDIIASTVTCTKTFQKFVNRTDASHCGYCSQCVDRQFAMYAAGLNSLDAVYDFDLASESFQTNDARTFVLDYFRQANNFSNIQYEAFYFGYLDELSDLVQEISSDEEEAVSILHELYLRHAKYIEYAYHRMVDLHSGIFRPKIPNSLYEVVDERRYQKESVELMASTLSDKLVRAIPVAYQHRQPEREHELNSLINSLIMTDRADYEREYPAVRFSFAVTVPDHSITNADYDLFIEAKYLRKKMSPSGITDELAADLVKYPEKSYKLFVIYDPERRIPDDVVFKRGFDNYRFCLISIVR